MSATTPVEAPGRTAGLPLPQGAAVPEWVMIARTGAWLGHPTAPEVITAEHLRSALDYFRRHHAAHGADLVVDYHHASVAAALRATRAPAAGWVRQMELRNGGAELWGRVLWTTEAARAVAARHYRYLSPVLRFDAPDRLSGRPVPMMIHSVALTNTPFMTELAALNCDETAFPARCPATDGRAATLNPEGGESMSVLDSLARALDEEPEQVASRLGLPTEGGAPDDAAVAGLVMANAARLGELEAAADGEAPPLPPYVANALGVAPSAAEQEVKAALIRLKAPEPDLAAVREKLGLPPEAPGIEVLNAIGALRQARRRSEAEELVDEAVRAGKIPPAHREFYLREALNDLEATRTVINAMAALTAAPPARPAAGRPALTAGERQVCRQLGIKPETFAGARS